VVVYDQDVALERKLMDIEHDEVLGNDNLDGENGVLAYEDGEAFGGGSFRVVDLDDVQDGVQEVRDGMDSLAAFLYDVACALVAVHLVVHGHLVHQV
jgi:hypothetical protein